MLEQLVQDIVIVDSIGLLVLAAYGRYRVTHGAPVSPRRAAQIVLGYFSFMFVSSLFPMLWANVGATILVMLILIALTWGIGYPWTLWVLKNVFDQS